MDSVDNFKNMLLIFKIKFVDNVDNFLKLRYYRELNVNFGVDNLFITDFLIKLYLEKK